MQLSRRTGLKLLLSFLLAMLEGSCSRRGARYREGTSPTFGNPSNEAFNERQVGTGGGGYTPFPFVTISNPTENHGGVQNRPSFSPTDPPSASVTDPMSGLQIFRIGGNINTPVFINGTTNSGLVYPNVLRNANNVWATTVWNADGSLLMLDEHKGRSGDPANTCRSLIIDVTGTRSGLVSGAWRVARASSSFGLGDGPGVWWQWDVLNPLRAYYVTNTGQIGEWWPVGGGGHSVGETNLLFGGAGLPSGLGSVHDSRIQFQSSLDGQWTCVPCRRNSDGRRGGMRRNLWTGAWGPFAVSPDYNFSGASLDHRDRATGWISALGNYTYFSPNGHQLTCKSLVTGALVSDTIDVDSAGSGHTDACLVNGIELFPGARTDSVRSWNIAAGCWFGNSGSHISTAVNAFAGANPNFTSCRNTQDTVENHGVEAGTGLTSGHRYLIYSRANPRSGHPPAVLGIRTGPSEVNKFRFICCHRSFRDDNINECHAVPNRAMTHVVFPSNWLHHQGGASGPYPTKQVSSYVVVIPDGWRSPNNDGS